jgi:NDP-sugar pyrophosphorylase family protein
MSCGEIGGGVTVIAAHHQTVMISGNRVYITGGTFIQENQISIQNTYIGKQGEWNLYFV